MDDFVTSKTNVPFFWFKNPQSISCGVDQTSRDGLLLPGFKAYKDFVEGPCLRCPKPLNLLLAAYKPTFLGLNTFVFPWVLDAFDKDLFRALNMCIDTFSKDVPATYKRQAHGRTPKQGGSRLDTWKRDKESSPQESQPANLRLMTPCITKCIKYFHAGTTTGTSKYIKRSANRNASTSPFNRSMSERLN